MKRDSLLILAAATACAVSCSQESVQEISSASEAQVIGFTTNTSRAAVATITTLQDDKAGFALYGAMANGEGEWADLMDGNNNYVYTDGLWGWEGEAPQWPEVDSEEYSIKFYAIYYLSGEGVTVTDDSQEVLAVNYAAPTDGQVDILVANATADARPAGDKLPLVFDHILAKSTFKITTGEGVTIYTQAVGFNNVCSEREYDIYGAKWNSQEDSNIDDYSFLNTINPAISSDTDDFEGTNGDLMLLPQTTTSWDVSDDSASGAHIYLFYRAKTSDDDNLIGYTSAINHPDYNSDTDDYTVALFVKVGYPLGTTDFEWEMGNNYIYDINLGTVGATNGYLLDEYYYDADGNVTTFTIKGKDVGDPVSDGYINFTVSVNAWEETTTTLE